MLDLSQILAFGFICVAMVLTPGPNMIYLISRSISQGKIAGFFFSRWRCRWFCILHALRIFRDYGTCCCSTICI